MTYTQSQWLLLFFIYCMAGWIWECCYVSLLNRTWVNRGFLHGPWLPIYGSGAILILFLTLPVQTKPALVFLLGMIGATTLEYVTGAVMEKIFQMRYWDYSDKPLNIKGYICLPASLIWGGFSLLLIEVLHPPLERLVLLIPVWLGDGLALGITVLFVVDCVKSTQAALDMKALLLRLGEQSETLQELESRLNVVVEQVSQRSKTFREKLQELEDAYAVKRNQLLQERKARSRGRMDQLMEILAQRRDQRSRLLSFLSEKADTAILEISLHLREELSEAERIHWEGLYHSVSQFRQNLRQAEAELALRRDRDYQKAVSILERNPSAASRLHGKTLEELKNLKRRKSMGRKKE